MNFQIYASASCCDWTSRPLVSSNMVSLSYTVLGEGGSSRLGALGLGIEY